VKVQKRHPKAHLVSDEVLDAAWREYRAEIWVPSESGASAFEHDRAEDEFTNEPVKAINAFPLDAGVAKWSKKSAAEIKEMLGIPERGLPGCRRNSDGTVLMEPMWHQWACVAEMIDRSFTEAGETGRPTLLADEVGMGKTAQSIVFIQVVWHLKTLQDTNPNWPETDGSDGIRKWPEFLGGLLTYRRGIAPADLT
jgi:SNF2 family DNA or RNA helicase